MNIKRNLLFLLVLCIAGSLLIPAFAVVSDVPAAKDTLLFGTYEQDCDTENGPEPIEWLILDRRDDRILVISRFALDGQPYNTVMEDITWETCSLRQWLNDSFYNTAFTAEEQQLILETELSADPNPNYDTDPGNTTTDRVFLLSTAEAERYFTDPVSRMCTATDYSKRNGVYVNKDYALLSGVCCWWWYRTPGVDSVHAAYSYYDGKFVLLGDHINNDDNAVRPALWLDISVLS